MKNRKFADNTKRRESKDLGEHCQDSAVFHQPEFQDEFHHGQMGKNEFQQWQMMEKSLYMGGKGQKHLGYHPGIANILVDCLIQNWWTMCGI